MTDYTDYNPEELRQKLEELKELRAAIARVLTLEEDVMDYLESLHRLAKKHNIQESESDE